MSGPVVVDVGNTRIKWGLCSSEQVWSFTALPPDDVDAWQKQWDEWKLQRHQAWIVSGVHPARRASLIAWLQDRCDSLQIIDSHKQLPIEVAVDAPEKVGIDRLLNAVAANRRRPANVAAILVDAGSAVTVDYLDSLGVFRGGAIFPGFRLMAKSLHDYTALLPLVELDQGVLPPGLDTIHAIQGGVLNAVLGGIERLIVEYSHRHPTAFEIFLTGGDAKHLTHKLHRQHQLWPEMTLEGVLHARPK